MLPKNPVRFVRTVPVLAAALMVCSFQVYGQRPDPRINLRRNLRMPMGVAAGAVAAKVAALRDAIIAQTLTPPPTAVGTFVTFDVPGAVNGTIPSGINNNGDIAGYYNDNIGSGFHGFIRAADGTFVTFDVPGAVNGTFPTGINNGGAITGGYGDNIDTGFHGFVRAANGTVVTFDAPDGGLLFSGVINPKGEVAGNYFDVDFVQQHSFLREPNGALTTIDPPAAVNGSFPSAITPNGEIVGVYFDADFQSNGFLRDRSGTFTTINGPGGLTGQSDPFIFFGATLSINPRGDIAGTYFEPIAGNPFGGNYRVFLLSKAGQYTAFDAADYPPCCIFSSPSGINPAGTVAGTLNDGHSVYRGFLRTKHGTVSTFDAPGAGTGHFQGTVTIGITPGGTIAGAYVGPNDGILLGGGRSHGFLFQPE
jgi:hypothetical protein